MRVTLRRSQKQAIMAASVALVVAGVVVLVLPASGKASGSPVAAAAGQPGAVPTTTPTVESPSQTPAAPTTASTGAPTATPTVRTTPSPSQPPAITPQPSAPHTTPAAPPSAPSSLDLYDPHKKEIANELVSSAENSSLNWRAQYKYIQDIGDGRGYTAGIVGFCSGTGDMLDLVKHYNALKPGNILAKYLPALQSVNGSASHNGLGTAFTNDWGTAANDPVFQQAQDDERDRVYFDPAVSQAKADGLRALGQFMYYDALVMHGPGTDPLSFGGIRSAALRKAKPPSQGGNETAYLNAFLDARKTAMHADPSHQDTSRVDTEQRPFLQAANLDLTPPLQWSTYGDHYTIAS
jgi:chitosanase